MILCPYCKDVIDSGCETKCEQPFERLHNVSHADEVEVIPVGREGLKEEVLEWLAYIFWSSGEDEKKRSGQGRLQCCSFDEADEGGNRGRGVCRCHLESRGRFR